MDELIEEMKVSNDDQFQMTFITAIYCIKNPFFNFECARNYLEKAEKLKQNDWQIPASRAVIAHLQGDLNEAKKQYKIAKDYYGSEIPYKDALKIPYLSNLKKELQ